MNDEIDFEKGSVFLIDKPYEWTSFDVINKLRFYFKKKYPRQKIKIGHAGTLDPLATGLLIVCAGKATKQIPIIQEARKQYTGTIFLGASTPSYDRETAVNQKMSTNHITRELLVKAANSFLGKQWQTAPIFSAKKINGVNAYTSARNGEEVKIKSHQIELYRFEITNVELPLVDFIIECSKGTYIRSIANDFGIKLNTLAYLYNLRRTRIGTYDIAEAKDFADIFNHSKSKRTFLAEHKK
jgi:tRNA pseudouridine55 synthase